MERSRAGFLAVGHLTLEAELQVAWVTVLVGLYRSLQAAPTAINPGLCWLPLVWFALGGLGVLVEIISAHKTQWNAVSYPKVKFL